MEEILLINPTVHQTNVILRFEKTLKNYIISSMKTEGSVQYLTDPQHGRTASRVNCLVFVFSDAYIVVIFGFHAMDIIVCVL